MPSSQSTAMVALRAFIMLACLVAFPLLAIIDLSNPKKLMAAISGTSLYAELSDLFSSVIVKGTANKAHGTDHEQNLPPLVDPQELPGLPRLDAPALVPASYLDSSPATVAPAGFHETYSGGQFGGRGLQPARIYQGGGSPETSPPQSEQQVWQAIRAELHQLGARHCALETWGNQGELYRFQAKLALQITPVPAGEVESHRYFSAVASDSVSAMQQVLDQVRSWREEQSQRYLQPN